MQLLTAILCVASLLAVAGAAENEDEYVEMHEMLDELKEIVKDMKKVNDKSTSFNEDTEDTDSVDSGLEFITDVTKEGSMCACDIVNPLSITLQGCYSFSSSHRLHPIFQN